RNLRSGKGFGTGPPRDGPYDHPIQNVADRIRLLSEKYPDSSRKLAGNDLIENCKRLSRGRVTSMNGQSTRMLASAAASTKAARASSGSASPLSTSKHMSQARACSGPRTKGHR